MCKLQHFLYSFIVLLFVASCSPKPGSTTQVGESYCGVKNGKDINTISPTIYREELNRGLSLYIKEVGEGSIGSNFILNAAGDGFEDYIYKIRKLEVEQMNSFLNNKNINLELFKATEQGSVNYLLYDTSLKKVISKTKTSFGDLIKGNRASLNGLFIKELTGVVCISYAGTDNNNYYIKMPIELIE